MICLPIILLVILVLVALIAKFMQSKDEDEIEEWMKSIQKDDEGVSWAEDKDGNWHRKDVGSSTWEKCDKPDHL